MQRAWPPALTRAHQLQTLRIKLSQGVALQGQIVTTLRSPGGRNVELGRNAFRKIVGKRGAVVNVEIQNVNTGIVLAVVGQPVQVGEPSLLMRAVRSDESTRTLTLDGRTHGITVKRLRRGGPIAEVRHTINGELAYLVLNEWRAEVGGWVLVKSTQTEMRGGKVSAELVTRVDGFTVASATNIDHVSKTASMLGDVLIKTVLPTEAHADDNCGAEALAVAATGWASYIACAGGVLLFTPTCGAALLAHAATSWALGNCMGKQDE